MKTPEGKIKDAVKKYLDSIGAYYFMPVQTGYGKSTLDFLVCWRGKFIAIETKAPGATRGFPLAGRQGYIAKKIEEAGGRVIVVKDGIWTGRIHGDDVEFCDGKEKLQVKRDGVWTFWTEKDRAEPLIEWLKKESAKKQR